MPAPVGPPPKPPPEPALTAYTAAVQAAAVLDEAHNAVTLLDDDAAPSGRVIGLLAVAEAWRVLAETMAKTPNALRPAPPPEDDRRR